MSYTKYTWVSGETITATKLNNIETELANVSETADIVNEILTSAGGLGYGKRAAVHNSIYRGKDLGTWTSSSSYFDAIADGTFTDMYIGDEIHIQLNNEATPSVWVIAHFDPYYNMSHTGLGSTHHIAIVPRGSLSSIGNGYWHSTDDISSGYKESTIRNNILNNTLKGYLQNALGSNHILTYTNRYPSAYTNGVATAYTDVNCCVELMNMIQVLGYQFQNNQFEIGDDQVQFALFKFNSYLIHPGISYWLRTVRNTSYPEVILSNGLIDNKSSHPSSTARVVRPFVLLG